MKFEDLDMSHFGNFTPEERACFFEGATAQVMGDREENEFIKRAQRDELVRQKRKQQLEEPMPKIKGRPEWGPIEITADEIERRKKEEATQKKFERMKAKANILRWFSMKRHIRRQIENLNPNKKKYLKKRAKLEVQIIDLDELIQCTCMLHDLKVVEPVVKKSDMIEHALKYLEKKAKSVKKTVKRFCKRNSDTIESIAIVTIPIIIAGIVKRIIGVPLDSGLPIPEGV